MDVNRVTLQEVQRAGLRGLRALSHTEMSTLYKRFGVAAIDQIGDTPETAPTEFQPQPGQKIGKFTVLRFAGRENGEASYEVTFVAGDGTEIASARPISALYAESLKKPPTAAEIQAMSGMQYAAAVKKFGEARIQKVLDAATPQSATADELEDAIGKALEARWHQVVFNQANITAIRAQLEQLNITPAQITDAVLDNAIHDGLGDGSVEADLRVFSGLSEKYGFDLTDRTAIRHLSSTDFARLVQPFRQVEKHWADGLTSDQFRAHLDANDRERGIEAPIPAVIRDRQAQTVATFRQIHPELEFENLSGADKIVNWLKETKRALTIQNMEIARQELLEAKTIMAVDGSQKVKYGATTLVDAGGHPQAQRVVPTRENVVVENTPKKWTRDQIRRMSSEEYSSHLGEPGFAEAVDSL